MKRLDIVGFGPGSYDKMTIEAVNALNTCDVIVGFVTYVNIVKQFFEGKEYISNGMGSEVDRVRNALDIANSGRHVCLVCSGDSSVYGMAALCYEIAVDYKEVTLNTIPGVTAALSGSALLGAAAGNDVVLISLSDYHTSWEMIEARLSSCAKCDFVMALYNPQSKKRPDGLKRACEILLDYLPVDRVCGIAENIGRDGEITKVMSLGELVLYEANMFTTVFIGNSSTVIVDGKMITPRGYREKSNSGSLYTNNRSSLVETNIAVFSGTSEGREISEFLSESHIHHDVYVATEYGEVVMEPSEYVNIHTGRLDESMMQRAFSDYSGIVIDATHPHAVAVTRNIKDVCAKYKEQIEYIRIQRNIDFDASSIKTDYEKIIVVDSTEEAIDRLGKTSGNILLTTGVKTLHEYTDKLLKDRIYSRILPSMESLETALATGISPKQIIAMEGPFTVDINKALIEQFDIKVLVTKNSGAKGGLNEKLQACRDKDITAVVIDANVDADGISVEYAKHILANKLNFKEPQIRTENVLIKETDSGCNKTITIAGIGVGNKESMTIATVEAIKRADLLIGAKRMLEIGLSINNSAESIAEYKTGEITKHIKSSTKQNIVILASGDTGLYSLATTLNEALFNEGIKTTILPAVSSIGYLCSKLQIAYSDASIISLHGKEADFIGELCLRSRVFAIVSGVGDVNEIIVKLRNYYEKSLNKGNNTQKIEIYIGNNLGMNDETVERMSLEDARLYDKEGLYVIGASING